MKIPSLRRKLIIEGTIVAGGTLVLCGLIWLLSSVAESTQNEKNKLSGEVAMLENQMQALRSKLQRFQGNNADFYKLFSKEAADKLLLNRSQVRPVFDALQSEYALGNMRVGIDSVQDMKESQFVKPRAAGLSANATISFTSFSDKESVNVLATLPKNLPGLVKYTKYAISRSPGVTAQGSDSSQPSVSNDIAFKWMGLKDPAPKNAAVPAAKPAAPPMPGIPEPAGGVVP